MNRLKDREEAFQRHRTSKVLGEKLRWYDKLVSTQSELKAWAETEAPEGLCMVAEVQTQGRGRGGNQWESPPGGLWFSVLLRPEIASAEIAALMPVTGQAVARVLIDKGVPATVKHPNDVLVDGKKVCGILAEAMTLGGEDTPRYVVLGVGLNLANDIPPALAETATSLKGRMDPLPFPERMLAWLLASIEAHLAADELPPLSQPPKPPE